MDDLRLGLNCEGDGWFGIWIVWEIISYVDAGMLSKSVYQNVRFGGFDLSIGKNFWRGNNGETDSCRIVGSLREGLSLY